MIRERELFKNNYYFLIYWYKGETLIIGMFHLDLCKYHNAIILLGIILCVLTILTN